MGGGDLNLKKSWHPHTMKNQEKVWKAEQAKSTEEKKLKDLRREIEEEKQREELKRIGRVSGVLADGNEGEKKLDWMYKNSTELINREEYLLGRKIDKSFEILQAEEKERQQQNLVGIKQPLNHVEHECVPFSIRSYKNLENSEQVDLQRKVMEDPLMLIKQREMESRRKILENPVKLKELHRILKTDEKLRKISKKSKKSKKLKRKHKKRKRSSSSSSESSGSDLDSKLAKKLKGSLLSKDETSSLGVDLAKLLDSKFEKISQELDKAVGRGGRSKKNKSKDECSDSDSSGRKYKSFSYQRYEDKTRSRHYQEEKNSYSSRKSSSRKDFRRKSRSRSTEKAKTTRENPVHLRFRDGNISKRRTSILPNGKGSTAEPIERSRSRTRDCKKYGENSKSPRETGQSHSCYKRDKEHKSSTKLTNEERQTKLKEMMSNATWREKERTKTVQEHREANAREEERHLNTNFDRNFLNKEVKKAMDNQTSVGERLRANLNNIQRTSSAMNSNFARK